MPDNETPKVTPVVTPVIPPKPESVVHPTLTEYDRDKTFMAKTGYKKGALNRYEIQWPVFFTDEELIERYGKDSKFFILHGIMEMSHGPQYNTILTDDTYTEAKHLACQKLADEHKPGNRKTGETAQVKADAAAGNAARASANKLGFATLEEAMAFAAMAKEKDNKKASKSKTK